MRCSRRWRTEAVLVDTFSLDETCTSFSLVHWIDCGHFVHVLYLFFNYADHIPVAFFCRKPAMDLRQIGQRWTSMGPSDSLLFVKLSYEMMQLEYPLTLKIWVTFGKFWSNFNWRSEASSCRAPSPYTWACQRPSTPTFMGVECWVQLSLQIGL